MRDKRAFGAIAALLAVILAGWLLGPQTTTGAQLSSVRWTMQSVHPTSHLSAIYLDNASSGEVYRIKWQGCGAGAPDGYIFPIHYVEH